MIVLHNGLKKENSFFDIVVLICVLYNSNSFLITVNSTLGFILTMVIILLGLHRLRYKVSRHGLFCGALLCVSALFSMCFNGAVDFLGTTIRFVAVIIAALIVARLYKLRRFVDLYINAIVFLTIVSFVPFAITNIWGKTDILRQLPVLTNPNGASVYSGVLFNVYTYRQDRNMSIFWEPAIFATYCAIAIALELCIKKRVRAWVVVVCSLGILSSFSTGGYLLFFFIFLLMLIKWLSMKGIGLKGELILTTALLFGVLAMTLAFDKIILWLNEINPDIFYKLIAQNESSSLTTRAESALYNLQLFSQKPILGWGLGNVDGYYVAMGGHNMTSTLTYYLAAFGLPGISYTLMWFTSILRTKYVREFSMKMVLLAMLLFVMLKEPFYFSMLFYTVLFGFMEQDEYVCEVVHEC